MTKILLICYKLQAAAYYVANNVFKSAVGFFSFFSSTNVETKNVCPIAYNGQGFVPVAEIELHHFKIYTNVERRTKS